MASLKYSANSSLQTVTLGSGYTSGSGSMTLTTGHGARLPSSGDFWLAYDNGAGVVRLFKVTARSTDTLTVTPDSTEGSGDGNISSGETLRWALTAAALDQLRADIVQTGAYSSASAAKAGSVYLPTDSLYAMRDTGSAFAHWGPIHKVVPPDDTTFSDITGGTPSNKSTTGGALYIDSTTATGNNSWRGRVIAIPSAPFTLEVGLIQHFRVEDYRNAALCLYDGTKLTTWGFATNAGNQLRLQKWNSTSSISSGVDYGNPAHMGEFFLKLVDDSTDWKFYCGPSLNNMELVVTETRNTFLTATHIGMCVNNARTSGKAGATFFHWLTY